MTQTRHLPSYHLVLRNLVPVVVQGFSAGDRIQCLSICSTDHLQLTSHTYNEHRIPHAGQIEMAGSVPGEDVRPDHTCHDSDVSEGVQQCPTLAIPATMLVRVPRTHGHQVHTLPPG